MTSKFENVQRAVWQPGTLVEVGYDDNTVPGIVVDFAGESLAYINIMVNGVIECIINPLWNKPFTELPNISDMDAVFQPIRLMRDNLYYDTVASSVGLAIQKLDDR
jgi:hypothetical protein